MGPLLLYLLKSTICLTLFYIGFKALLSNDTFFRFNRWVLLGGVVVCMLLPFIKLQTSELTLIQRPIMQLEQLVSGEMIANDQTAGKPENTLTAPLSEQKIKIDWEMMIGIVYLSGALFCLIVTLSSFHKMFFMIRKGRKIRQDKYTLILMPSAVAPFSWGHYIILSEDDYRQYPDEILTHERMHLQSRHSLDLIFMELVVLLHWFNPAIWLLKRELKEIHEFEADDGVLNQGIDATKYQLLLVKKAVGSSRYTLANSFNHSKIKKRITMMLKKQSNRWARLKLLLLVPVGLIALNAFARPGISRQLETLVQSKDKETPPEDQQDLRSFFSAELEKYIKKVDTGSALTPEGINAFLDKNTNKQYLFINARGDLLLNFKAVTAEQLPVKLQEIFKASANDKKPVAYYSLQDVNTPKKAIDDLLEMVKNAFLKQQAAVGADKVPTLLFLDTGNSKNFPVKQQAAQSDNKAASQSKKSDDMLPPPPPPNPNGFITFSYKSGKEDRGFPFYERHAKPGKGLEQRIDKIYTDDISTVTITLIKKAPDGLLEGVQKILNDKIKYDVKYLVKKE